MHEVSVIGLKLEGSVGSAVAELLPMSLIAAVFQACGTDDVDQQRLKSSTKE